jgi:diaminopimelate decarboxylase
MATDLSAAYSEFISRDSDGSIVVDGVHAGDLIDTYGTPLYVISEQQIRTNVARFKQAFVSRYPNVEILFATKANNNLGIRRAFTMAGAGGETFGYGELLITLAAGTSPEYTVLNGFWKTDAELTLAIEKGVLIHLDSAEELEQVIDIARKVGRTARLGIRTRLMLHALDRVRSDWADSNDVDPENDSIGRNQRERDKFGVSPQVVREIVKVAMEEDSVDLLGLHHHIGRELPDATLWNTTVGEQMALAGELKDELGWMPSYFDFGGGMAWGRPEGHGPSGHDRDAPSYEEYAEVITSNLKAGLREHGLGEPLLLLEPGRSIASNIGVLLTRVTQRKAVPETDQIWLCVDASHGHMPNAMDGGFYYHAVEGGPGSSDTTEVVNIADPNCWYGNLVLNKTMLRREVGDVIAFLDTGAYCETKSSNFNLILKPATVLVNDGNTDVVTERETLDHLLARVRVPERLRCDEMSDYADSDSAIARAIGVAQ